MEQGPALIRGVAAARSGRCEEAVSLLRGNQEPTESLASEERSTTRQRTFSASSRPAASTTSAGTRRPRRSSSRSWSGIPASRPRSQLARG